MRVRHTPRARADIEAIFAYLDSRNPSAARGVKRALDQAVELLALFPLAGPEIDRAPQFRGLLVGRYPYRLYYRIRDDEVWIVHVRHLRQRTWEGQ
jgi:plasmid stabilization system protein ParE